MSNSPEQPTGTDGPLRYAPRRTHDDPRQSRDPSAPSSTKSTASHPDGEPTGDNVFRDRPFPVREMRFSPPPPSPAPTRGRFAALRDLATLSLVAIVSSSLVALIYPWLFSRQPDSARVNSPAPQVAVNESPGAARIDERAGVPPVAASLPAPSAAVTTPRAAGPAVRGVTDTEIRFGMAGPLSGSARELGRQMKL